MRAISGRIPVQVLRAVAAGLLWLGLALAAQAEITADRARLNEALGIPALLELMQIEGQRFGEELGGDFLPDRGGAAWAAIVARIYDPEKMLASVNRGMEAEITDAQVAPLLAFFTSQTGRKIVDSEIAAREAFLDTATEEAARAAYRDAGESEAARLKLLRKYVSENDLVEFNVTGALNSNLRFYRGLVEGGSYEMTEEEMLIEVWGQEEETRADTDEWLMAYLLVAYSDLNDAELAEYIVLSAGEAGQALNRALFAGFDAMYADLSYALGLAISVQLKGEDL